MYSLHTNIFRDKFYINTIFARIYNMNNNQIATSNINIKTEHILNILSLVDNRTLMEQILSGDNTELLNFLLFEKKIQDNYKKKDFLSSLIALAINKSDNSEVLSYLFNYDKNEFKFIHEINSYDLRTIMQSQYMQKTFKTHLTDVELKDFNLNVLNKMSTNLYFWADNSILENFMGLIFPVNYTDTKVLNSLVHYLTANSQSKNNNILSTKIIATLKKEKISGLDMTEELMNNLKLMAVHNAKRICEESSYKSHPASKLNHYLAHFNLCAHFNINLDTCKVLDFESAKNKTIKSTLENSDILSELRKYVNKNKQSSSIVGEFLIKRDKKALLKSIDLADGNKHTRKQMGNRYKI